MDHLDKAVAEYTEAIRRNPKDAGAHFSRGGVYKMREEWDRAFVDFTAAIQLDPNYAMAYSERGGIHGLKGQLDLAIADYTEAIRLNPNDARAYSGRGLAFHDSGELDRAVVDLTEAIRLNPGSASEYLVWRGNAYRLKGEQGKANEDFARALTLSEACSKEDVLSLEFLRKAKLAWVPLPEQEFAGLSDDDKWELRALEAEKPPEWV